MYAGCSSHATWRKKLVENERAENLSQCEMVAKQTRRQIKLEKFDKYCIAKTYLGPNPVKILIFY